MLQKGISMLTLKVYKDEDKLREISVEDNNFLLVQNGNYGPVYDTDNFAFLRIDEKHVINQRYLQTIRKLYTKFDKYLYTL